MDTEHLTKITLIEDINKMHNLEYGGNLTAENFDELYDMPNEDLERVLQIITAQHERAGLSAAELLNFLTNTSQYGKKD